MSLTLSFVYTKIVRLDCKFEKIKKEKSNNIIEISYRLSHKFYFYINLSKQGERKKIKERTLSKEIKRILYLVPVDIIGSSFLDRVPGNVKLVYGYTETRKYRNIEWTGIASRERGGRASALLS